MHFTAFKSDLNPTLRNCLTKPLKQNLKYDKRKLFGQPVPVLNIFQVHPMEQDPGFFMYPLQMQQNSMLLQGWKVYFCTKLYQAIITRCRCRWRMIIFQSFVVLSGMELMGKGMLYIAKVLAKSWGFIPILISKWVL